VAADAPLAQALIEALDESALDALAERLAPLLAPRLSAPANSTPWLDAAGAAEYLATTRERVYDLVQVGKLVPHRDGRRLLFRGNDLDRYLAGS
jgi:excisionase family DNA binding protein